MSHTTTFEISPVDVKQRQKLELTSGNTVRVWQKIQEKGKTRLQAFEGMLIAKKHGSEAGATFTVRRVSGGVGVEKTFPLYSPNIEKIEIVKRSKVRRSKLYYIRDKAAKEIRRRTKRLSAIAAQKAKEAELSMTEEEKPEAVEIPEEEVKTETEETPEEEVKTEEKPTEEEVKN